MIGDHQAVKARLTVEFGDPLRLNAGAGAAAGRVAVQADFHGNDLAVKKIEDEKRKNPDFVAKPRRLGV